MPHNDAKIAIIGAGVVGGALRAWFESQSADVRPFDPPKGFADRATLERADVVFICVPTPYTVGHGFDDRHLLKAVQGVPGEKIVVIKSTVLPGTTDLLQARHPQHRFMFNPEFLREATAVADMMNPDRQIVGCTAASRTAARLVLDMLPPAPFTRICSATDAEMAKYAANCFLAVKVSYANEIYDLCARLGADYRDVRDIVAADERIGGSHLDVFAGGYRGYGGKCLPKDSRALLDLARSAGVDLRVLQATNEVNASLFAQRQPAEAREPHPIALTKAEAERAA